MEQRRSEGNFWPFFATVALSLILLAIIRWSLWHPYGVHWDESLYLNEAHIDLLRLHDGMLLTLAKRFLIDNAGRPPAYRLLALPFLAILGFHTFTTRLVTLVCAVLSCCFLFKATRRVGSRVAGTFAVMIFALSPEVISVSAVFSTDSSLYLAVAAMFYYLLTYWKNPADHPRSWIGLGLSLVLGFLSKTSFLLIAVPVFAFWLVADYCGWFDLPRLLSQWKAGLIALVAAAPWWVLNIKNAIAYANYARGYERHSLGPPSLSTWLRWLNTVFQGLLGHGVSLLIVLVVVVLVCKAFAQKGTLTFEPLQKAAIAACICAIAPLVLAQLSGTNHLLRYLTPPMIPLAIVIGVLVDKLDWGRSWATGAVSATLLSAQLVMLLAPVAFPNDRPVTLGFVTGALPWRALTRMEQWDWSSVRDLSNRCARETQKISFLGSGRAFDPPAIQFPWLDRESTKRRSASDMPYVGWLWRYEEGPIDWQKVMDVADRSDIVLTAPHYVGELRNKEDRDNQHNSEFVERLSQDQSFQGPFRLQVGNLGPVEVDAFVKKSLDCPVDQPVPSRR